MCCLLFATHKGVQESVTTKEQHYTAYRFSPARPIEKRSSDILGRAPFAVAVAEAIRGWEGRDSLVIALYGPWGSGKSSIKNMVVETLREAHPDVVIAEFNPWQFAHRDRLAESFFDQLGIALDRGPLASDTDRKKLPARWKQYAAYLTGGRDLVEATGTFVRILLLLSGATILVSVFTHLVWVAYVVGVLLVLAAALRSSSGVVQAVVGLLEARIAKGERSLEDVKDELSRDLAELKAPLLVVLDDIDRLPPKEVQKIFQLIKANADFPNVVYLVLFERQVVEKHIEATLKVSGSDYLEKIVQVGFDVPVIERTRLNKVLLYELTKLLQDEAVGRLFDRHRWGNLFFGDLQTYFETLRHVNRFISSLSFHIALFRSEGSFEVNPVDLIGLEVLRVFEPEVYSALPSHKEVLTNRRGLEGNEQRDQRKQMIVEIVDRAPEERREGVREILKQLFPPAEWALGGNSYGGGFEEGWYRELRICSAEVFDRYFGLAIPEGDISQSTIDRILASAADRTKLRREFRSLAELDLLGVAMDRLEAYKEKISIEHAAPFVTAMFDMGEELPQGRGGLLSISSSMHAVRIVFWYLQQEPDERRREQILCEAIQATEGVSLPVEFVSLEPQGAESQGPESRGTVNQDALAELKRLCVLKIEVAAAGGRLSAKADLPYLLYRWKDWGNGEKPKRFCEDLVRTPGGVLALLRAFLSRSTSQGMGDHVQREHWRIKLSDIDTFVPWQSVEAQLAGIQLDSLTEEDRKAVAEFERAVERRRHVSWFSRKWRGSVLR